MSTDAIRRAKRWRSSVLRRSLELVQRVKFGGRVAFRALVERHESKIHSVIYGILRNRDDTDEITQGFASFARVYFSIKSFGVQMISAGRPTPDRVASLNPDATTPDVLVVLRDYGRHKETSARATF